MYRLILYILLFTYGFYTFGLVVGQVVHTVGHIVAEGTYQAHSHHHGHHHHHAEPHEHHQHHRIVHHLLSQSDRSEEPASTSNVLLISLLLNIVDGILQSGLDLFDIEQLRPPVVVVDLSLHSVYQQVPSPPPKPILQYLFC